MSGIGKNRAKSLRVKWKPPHLGTHVYNPKSITLGAKRRQRCSGCLIAVDLRQGACPCERGGRSSSSHLSLVLSRGQAGGLRTLRARPCLLQIRAGTAGGSQRPGSRHSPHHGRSPGCPRRPARWPRRPPPATTSSAGIPPPGSVPCSWRPSVTRLVSTAAASEPPTGPCRPNAGPRQAQCPPPLRPDRQTHPAQAHPSPLAIHSPPLTLAPAVRTVTRK